MAYSGLEAYLWHSRMRISSVFDKPPVKRGFSSTVAPRLLWEKGCEQLLWSAFCFLLGFFSCADMFSCVSQVFSLFVTVCL